MKVLKQMLAAVVMLGAVSAGALAMNVQKKGDQNLPPRPENKVVSKPRPEPPPQQGGDNRQREDRNRDKERRPKNQSFGLNRFFSM